MPVSAYFKGKGRKVMADMVREYGPEKGKRVFYAVANKQGDVPAGRKKARPKRRHYS